jgi:hypothetical protein
VRLRKRSWSAARRGQPCSKLADHSIQVVKHPVGKLLFAQFIANMFLRIQFRRIGGQGQQPDVLGDRQIFGIVRTGSVQHHHNRCPLRVQGGGRLVLKHKPATGVAELGRGRSVPGSVGRIGSAGVRAIPFGAAKESPDSGEIVVAGGAPRPVRPPAGRPSVPG